MNMLRAICVSLLALFVLAGCNTTATSSVNTRGTEYSSKISGKPSRVVMAQQAENTSLDKVRECVIPYVKHLRIGIAPWTDNAGKTNSVADSGTGNFLTGAATGDFVINELRRLGITVQDFSSLAGETNLRALSGEGNAPGPMALKTAQTKPHYMLNGTNMSLDFDKNMEVSLLVKGLGGDLAMQRATLSGAVKLVRTDGSVIIDGFGFLKMSVYSRQGSGIIGRVVGTSLVTGGISGGSQQTMQLWNGEHVATIAALKAVIDLPQVPRSCTAEFDKVIQKDIVTI